MQQIKRNRKGQIQKGNSGNLAGRTTEVTKVAEQLPLKDQVVNRLNELKFCPVSKLVDLSKNARSEKVQCEAAAKLLDKIAPNLKSVEIDPGDSKNGFTLNVYYSKNAQEVSQDPFNIALSKMKPVTINHDS